MVFDSWKNRVFSSLAVPFSANFVLEEIYGFQIGVYVSSVFFDLIVESL